MKQSQEALTNRGLYHTAANYIEVLKPKESLLLTFIGVCASVAAILILGVQLDIKLLYVAIIIAMGSGGVNGLTNYLDRGVDAKMKRTAHRSLPSKRIEPAEKSLPLIIGLTVVSLGLAYWLHPLCFAFGVLGTVTAVVQRKTVLCPFLGAISGCAPVLIGWLAFDPKFSLPILVLCILILIWVPLHVWSVMIANREDYLGGGVCYFPLTWKDRQAVKVLLGLSVLLYAVSLLLWFVSDLGLLYFIIANILGVIVLVSSIRLVLSQASQDAWRLYKLSAFPYLGIIFLVMCLSLWLA